MNAPAAKTETPSPPAAPEPMSGHTAERAAALAAWGLAGLGLIAGARVVAGIGGAGTATEGTIGRLLAALYVAAAHGLAGVGLGALIRGVGIWLRSRALRDDAFRRCLVEISARLEALSGSLAAAPPAPTDPKHPAVGAADLAREQSAADIRRAIRTGDWNTAGALLDAFSRDDAEDSHVATLAAEHRAAKEAALRDHTAQLDTARKVGDPERVLELHQAMIPLLEAEARASLEADLSQWFLRLIHKRLRTGKIQADVAVLAGRIAEAFNHTVEGASLRASLPTLRRSAGLCPRCAQPYTGLADACPNCLAAARVPAPPPMPPEPTES